MFRYFIVFFLFLLVHFSYGQIVLTQTQSDATVGLDRKAWNGLGNTILHSDGYAHDFTLPARTNPCQQITGITVLISLTNYTTNNVCPHSVTYYNLFYGCTPYAGGATCLPATNLLTEPNFPANMGPTLFNFENPLGSPLNPNIVPDFGDNLSIDIIPVSNPGCNAVTNGDISYQYTITVTVTVTDIPPTLPILECWETATINNTTCTWDITGTQPVQPVIECWETAMFNTTTCSWDVIGTEPVQPILECWETVTINNTTCTWDITGTQPVQPVIECWETTMFNTTTCSWEITGTQPVQPALECWEVATFNTTACSWDIAGTQPTQPIIECWETATFNTTTCSWDITGTQPGNIIEEDFILCEDDDLYLTAITNILNPNYIWSTGDTTNEIRIDKPGVYTVEISGGLCSFETRIFNITGLENPIIETVVSDGNEIIISTSNNGDFLYSLDGNIFQPSNIFYNIKGGLYTIYVKERNCDAIVRIKHLHFFIPKFLTPNNDGMHDTFSLAGIEYYESSEVSIYDRYGKLLKFSRNSLFSWDGTFNNQDLPSDDYWYIIIIEGQKFTGHFTLKH